jgi:hypothetical protein
VKDRASNLIAGRIPVVAMNRQPYDDDLNNLRAALNERAAELATYLIKDKPNRQRSNKRELRFGTKGSLSVVTSGPKSGSWFNYENQKGGGLFDLIMREQNCSFVEALRFAREYLGDAPLPTRPSPSLRVDDDVEAEKKHREAMEIWNSAVSIDHPLPQRYFERRGLMIPHGIDGRALRFHGRCKFGLNMHPCIIALFTGIEDNEPRAITRIALTPDSQKIDRKMLGPVAGAAIKLWADADVTSELCVAEGIETSLAASMLNFTPVWSLGSAGSIASFRVVDRIARLTIIVDNDLGGAGQRAAGECSEQWTNAGHNVRRVMPRRIGDDLNDVLRRRSSP